MNSKLEKIENGVATLEITISAEKMEEGMKKAYAQNAKKYNVPGFRKGKVPRKMIEKFYGETVFYEDAINNVCPEAYEAAIKENNLETIDRPEIDIVDIGSEKGIIFKATVALRPEVKLGDYKGIEAEKKEFPVTEEDVAAELEALRQKNARMIEVADRAVKNGDITMVDFKGFVDDKQFDGGTAEKQKLEIGAGMFIPGFEEQLIGAEIGKEVDVNVSFPVDYQNAELAGKPALFKVIVNEIKEKQLLELDDEFAKDVSVFDTLEEMKADLKAKKQLENDGLADKQFKEDIISKVSENAHVVIPDIMVDVQVENMLRDFEYQLKYQGLDLKSYLGYMNMDEAAFKVTYRPAAYNRVKNQLVLESIAKAENITVSEEEVDADLEKTAKMYNKDLEAFKKVINGEELEYIKDGILVQKTVDFIMANSIEKK